ncbi:uncharacterized protein BO88DRAFT_231601 [Aspergillus vadensis CBS 113365]|uniref:Uncharacterized protein n=1 Tax=Aspergillus vadensis (strain CBS 113365 / IMI 142717 / IBT 24658) TaxID=1448311 RepID=A0A319BHQ3_ASPVC|nr:hypothetical protein BO88DRAFT_231601 [Aspergillus vadensis CBS 113365]PYH71489.1 hypothetical protein BO88DRAFT_231601 [Aspergillus vadensis CBS 113365]
MDGRSHQLWIFFDFLFLWTFSGLDIPGAAGVIPISISLIGISLSLVLVVSLPHELLSSGSSPSNSVWHRREQRILHNAAALVYFVYPCVFFCTAYHLGWHLSISHLVFSVYLQYLRSD